MSSELRAAAEFILSEQHESCDHIWNAHQQCQWCHRMRRDVHANELASAYLAEHPADDDEPVTRDWLESLPFIDDGCDGLELSIHNARHGTVSLVVWHSSGEFFVDGSTAHPQPDTRRDVRSLIAALKGE